MSSSRATIFSAYTVRRPRRPSLSLARLLLILCLGAHALGQTFQYSRGWTNGRKRAFAPPTAADVRKEMMSPGSPTEKEGSEIADEGTSTAKQWIFPEGKLISLGSMDKGRLEAVLVMLGNNGQELEGDEGEDIELMKQKGVDLGGRRKVGWRWNTLSERFLRRRRRREAEQREGSSIATFN